MTVAVWIIAVCMVLRVVQNQMHLISIIQARKEEIKRYNAFESKLDDMQSEVDRYQDNHDEFMEYLRKGEDGINDAAEQ